jgi:gluconolactonase
VVDGEVTVLADSWNGHRFNSPNDIVVKSDGAIWFTDPPYGIFVEREGHPGEQEYGDNYVFRFEPATAAVVPVVIDMEEPNGLAFSPDESLLYIADTSCVLRQDGGGNRHLRVYDVVGGVLCKNGRFFATVEDGVVDGFRVDVYGNVWASSETAVVVFRPDGSELAHIPVPERIGNLCFGGDDGTDLYIAASTSLYRIPTLVTDCARHGGPVRV